MVLDPQDSWWELNGNGIAFWVTLAIGGLIRIRCGHASGVTGFSCYLLYLLKFIRRW